MHLKAGRLPNISTRDLTSRHVEPKYSLPVTDRRSAHRSGSRPQLGGLARPAVGKEEAAAAAVAKPAAPVPADAAAGGKAAATAAPTAAAGAKSDTYSKDMSKAMGASLTYRHEDGLNYNRITEDIIVGSCLQTAADVDYLAENEGVRVIFSLQEDCDMAYFNLDLKPIQERCAARGDVKHIRFPVRDFDPFDLRRKLPKAVSRLAREHDPTAGTVYIHCTAGMGRAPATALAYMTWLRGWQLDAAYAELRGKRMCSPRIEAIRSATGDLLLGSDPVPAVIGVTKMGTHTDDYKIAGLDFGWHKQQPLEREGGRLVYRTQLPPGKYVYKFVVDGNWTYSADHPTLQDGNNINNYLEVLPRSVSDHLFLALRRLLSPGGDLTAEEREEMVALLCPWATHDSVHGGAGGAEPGAWEAAVDRLP